MISVLIPCRNEEKHIEKLIDDLRNQTYEFSNLEVFIIDGMSTDRTRQIIKSYSESFPNIILLDNPQLTTPYALNLGIKNSTRQFIMIVGAHSSLPKNYVEDLVYWQKRLSADNVGYLMNTIEANESSKAKAIAYSMSHPFGVGNSYFRIGSDLPREVDTVPFGFYKREVFASIGYFDVELTRNQDDEFNARLKKNGGKIFLVPGCTFKYFARDKFKKLWEMYFLYGYFKPLVLKKIGQPSSIRQLIPLIFVSVLLISFVFSSFSKTALIFLISVMLSWIVASLYFSIKSNITFSILVFRIFSFFILHFSYGLGYFKGIIDFLILKKEKKNQNNKYKLSR